jgi:hypothetical protein
MCSGLQVKYTGVSQYDKLKANSSVTPELHAKWGSARE